MTVNSTLRRRSLASLLFCLTCGLAANAPGASAQDADASHIPVARPGDGTVDGSFLQPYAAEFRLERRDADGRVTDFGRWTDTLRYVEQDGRTVLRRRVTRYTAEGVVDLWREHLVETTTLAPIRTYQKIGVGLQGSMEILFSDESLTANLVNLPTPGEQSVQRPLTEPVFDLALYATLLSAFPLKEGYEARFPVYGQSLEVDFETMRVAAAEDVAVEGGNVTRAFPVTTETRTWTAWLTKEVPHIGRIVQRFPDGSEVTSVRVSWKRLDR